MKLKEVWELTVYIYSNEREQAIAWFLASLIQKELVHQNPEAFAYERAILE